MSAMIYLETGSLDPFYNLAFEEFVLRRPGAEDVLMLWQNDNAVIIGRNQNAEEEINRAFVEERRIRVARRITGGGAVYHDLGNLNYSFITDAGAPGRLSMDRFTAPVVRALRGLGLEAEASGRNDILVLGRKVSGTAQRLCQGRVLHHGTLLFDADPGMISGALNADPAKFQSKSAKSVRSRVGNIRSFLKEDMDLPAFWDYLKGAFAEGELRPGRLTERELSEVEELRRGKYDTWEWNFGRSPRYSALNRRRWPGGSLEVRALVEDGRIRDIVFYGDFLALRPLDEVVAALRGRPFREDELAAALALFPLHEYFGEITKRELLETILRIS